MLQDVLFNGEVPAKVPQHDEKKETSQFLSFGETGLVNAICT